MVSVSCRPFRPAVSEWQRVPRCLRAFPRVLAPRANQLSLRLLRTHRWMVNVGTLGFVTVHQPFLRHALKQLQRRGVTRAVSGPSLVNVQYGTWPTLPENAKQFQFRLGGFWGRGFTHVDIIRRLS